jgi:hypothetical protein
MVAIMTGEVFFALVVVISSWLAAPLFAARNDDRLPNKLKRT